VVREVLAASSVAADGVTDADVATVAMSPGKPQALARWRGVPWLALPGNPVGAYASFELFARPAIDRLRGLDVPGHSTAPGHGVPGRGGNAEGTMLSQRYPLRRQYVILPAAVTWSSPAGRLHVLPVRVTEGAATPCGSHHALSALATADGLALVPPDVEKVRAGDLVPVLMLR
jgi:molybdopterin molybdotransferase